MQVFFSVTADNSAGFLTRCVSHMPRMSASLKDELDASNGYGLVTVFIHYLQRTRRVGARDGGVVLGDIKGTSSLISIPFHD